MAWKLIKYASTLLLVVGLVFSSGVFSVLLYAKITDKDWSFRANADDAVVYAEGASPPSATASPAPEPSPTPGPSELPAAKPSAMLKAPAIAQYPELPAGCEITSLAMLLQYAGVSKGKMDLIADTPVDMTPIVMKADGKIVSWGNPNTGYVGDVTNRTRGFAIYHGPLLQVMQKYIKTGVDLTDGTFDDIERYVSAGMPVVVWTTIDFNLPSNWYIWDTPIGPIRTTFSEHAVLMVGYDKDYVYVNDPRSGKAAVPVAKNQFVQSWEALGKQAISYRNP
ncbi:C39 family peptidase [Paenibacillus cymbidii]|uniref:C39 family peptidase n=1 Tax=Paenibacillus cymbidii TaxID=1639034 RepID=UPI001081E595|nr:C39 family peptidase [Paenibacillus cymbidii]